MRWTPLSDSKSGVEDTYKFIILSPILLVESPLMLSPRCSSLCFNLLADRRRDLLFVSVGVPSFEAYCTCTTGMGVSRFASDSELSAAMVGA